MTAPRSLPSRLAGARERGVVLFISLIVMVALALAAIALVRSIDSTTAVVGNLAFRQASVLPTNRAVEEAFFALFQSALIPDRNASTPAQSYYACRRDLLPANGGCVGEAPDALGVPALLTNEAAYDGSGGRLIDDGNGNQIRYVIERMCMQPGTATNANCDLIPPKMSPGTTAAEYPKPELPRVPFYRVTIRVDGPRNTVSYAQAMLR
jgi:hypothetical protein